MLGAWALPKPRSNKEGQRCRAHGFPLFGHHLASPRLTCSPHETGKSPRHGNGRLCCTSSRHCTLLIRSCNHPDRTSSVFRSGRTELSCQHCKKTIRLVHFLHYRPNTTIAITPARSGYSISPSPDFLAGTNIPSPATPGSKLPSLHILTKLSRHISRKPFSPPSNIELDQLPRFIDKFRPNERQS
jgi:hypothetical protein